MSEEIREYVKDPLARGGGFNIILDPTTSINALVMQTPVIWRGTIDQLPVEVVQKHSYARSYDDVDFNVFPSKGYDHYKSKIIDLIDEALKRYD
jgi:hypothetical protein